VHVELPEEAPQLTPDAARVLLRILLKAHAAQTAQQAHRDRHSVTGNGQEGECP
jgi:hypothetical protein